MPPADLRETAELLKGYSAVLLEFDSFFRESRPGYCIRVDLEGRHLPDARIRATCKLVNVFIEYEKVLPTGKHLVEVVVDQYRLPLEV